MIFYLWLDIYGIAINWLYHSSRVIRHNWASQDAHQYLSNELTDCVDFLHPIRNLQKL